MTTITTTTVPSGDPLALASLPVPVSLLTLVPIDADLAFDRIASQFPRPTTINLNTPTPRAARTHLVLETES